MAGRKDFAARQGDIGLRHKDPTVRRGDSMVRQGDLTARQPRTRSPRLFVDRIAREAAIRRPHSGNSVSVSI